MMIDNILNSFNLEAKEIGINAHYLARSLYKCAIHEAMIKCRGNFTDAAKLVGLSRTAARKYLGMSQKEWVKKYGYLYEK